MWRTLWYLPHFYIKSRKTPKSIKSDKKIVCDNLRFLLEKSDCCGIIRIMDECVHENAHSKDAGKEKIYGI